MEDRTFEEFNKTLNANLIAPIFVSREVAKYMLESKKGKIINISSTSGSTVLTPESIDLIQEEASMNALML